MKPVALAAQVFIRSFEREFGVHDKRFAEMHAHPGRGPQGQREIKMKLLKGDRRKPGKYGAGAARPGRNDWPARGRGQAYDAGFEWQ